MEKPWYLSKIVWLGVIVTLQGIVPLVVELLNKSAVSPADIALAFSGVLVVIVRVWFTDVNVEKG
jgi:hypothetical protein